MSFTFAIVGGGLTGTAMLQLFAEKMRQEIDLNLLNPSEIKIQIFEKWCQIGFDCFDEIWN